MSLSLGLVGAGHGPSAAGSVGASGGPPYLAADGTYRKMPVTGLSSLAGLPIRSKKKWEKSSRCKSVVRDRRLGLDVGVGVAGGGPSLAQSRGAAQRKFEPLGSNAPGLPGLPVKPCVSRN